MKSQSDFNKAGYESSRKDTISGEKSIVGAPSFLQRESDKSKDLFILNVTLSNKQQYNVRVKRNMNPTKIADLFCYENGLSD